MTMRTYNYRLKFIAVCRTSLVPNYEKINKKETVYVSFLIFIPLVCNKRCLLEAQGGGQKELLLSNENKYNT